MQALVTGATSGIGKAIAIALHDAGHAVIALGRQPEAIEDLKKRGIHGIAIELTDRENVRKAVEGLQVDVLINNAGMVPPLTHFCDMDSQDIDRAIDVNIRSVIGLTHLIAPSMQARKSGHIFFTGSTAGHAPFPNYAVYCATKAAIGGFAQALRLDLAPFGVRVTEIVAGRVETNLYKNILSQDARDAMYAGHSAVQPEDVAKMVLATLALPPTVDVARFDILPTHQATITGNQQKGK